MERVYAPRALARISPRDAVLRGIEAGFFADRSQIVLGNSRSVADEIARRHGVPGARLAVIYNGVDLERFHPRLRDEAALALRAELRLDGPVALFAGSGFARKGLDRAIAGLARSGVKGSLLVAGAGDAAAFRAQAGALGIGPRV